MKRPEGVLKPAVVRQRALVGKAVIAVPMTRPRRRGTARDAAFGAGRRGAAEPGAVADCEHAAHGRLEHFRTVRTQVPEGCIVIHLRPEKPQDLVLRLEARVHAKRVRLDRKAAAPAIRESRRKGRPRLSRSPRAGSGSAPGCRAAGDRAAS